jgi:hypothetical protein
MENKFGTFWNGLPTWSKGVLAIGGVGILFIIGRTIYKNAQASKELQAENQAGIKAAEEIKVLENQGLRATYMDSQYETFSQSLVDAMNGCGTTEDNVYNVFRSMKNDVDIRKLISIFGIRYYQPCAASQPVSYTKWLWDDQSFGGGLPSWLSYDLTTDEIQQVNAILKSNNVNYSF